MSIADHAPPDNSFQPIRTSMPFMHVVAFSVACVVSGAGG
jgi:hypothetical protein